MGDVTQTELRPADVATAWNEAKVLNQSFSLSVADIRGKNRAALIQTVARTLDSGKVPTLTTTKALFAKIAERKVMNAAYEDDAQRPVIPWPEDKIEVHQPLTFDQTLGNRDYIVLPNKLPTFPNGIDDHDDSDGVMQIAFAALNRLQPEERAEMTDYLLTHANLFIDEKTIGTLFAFLRKSPNREELFLKVADYLYTHRDEYTYSLHEKPNVFNSPVDELVSEIGIFDANHKPFFEALSTIQDDEKMKTLLGMFVVQASYPDTLNTLRALIENPLIPEHTKMRLNRMGRILLGIPADSDDTPFFTSLNAVYKSLAFEKYPTNEAVTADELAMIHHIVSELPQEVITDGVIVDLACGTGRHTNGLAAMHKDLKIIGIDQSQDHLHKAQQSNPTHSVTYQHGDMRKTGLPDNLSVLTLSLGRNDPHLEKRTALYDALRERVRITKVGGVILSDLPNPDKGDYLENRKKHLDILRALSIPVDKLAPDNKLLAYVPYIADGPKGEQNIVYNRLCLPIEKIVAIYQRLGCDVRIYKRAPIAGGNGDENIYILARKKFEQPSMPSWYQRATELLRKAA